MKQYWQKQTNQQNPIFQIWLTWFFENKGDFWKFYSLFRNYYYYYQNNHEKRYYKLQDFSGDYCAF